MCFALLAVSHTHPSNYIKIIMTVFPGLLAQSLKMSEELTNLNWLSFAPIEINASQVITVKCVKTTKTVSLDKPDTAVGCSADDHHDDELMQKAEACLLKAVERRKINRRFQRPYHKRPQCSYSCLITMALKASETGCLPVHLIYKYIE